MNRKQVRYLLILGMMLSLSSIFAQQQFRIELSKIEAEEKLIEARLLVIQNKPDKAADLLLILMSDYPSEGVFPYELSRVYYEDLDESAMALKYIEKAIKLDENNTWYLSRAAYLYSINSNIAKELELNQRLVDLEPENLAHYKRVVSNLLRLGKPDEAVKTIENFESIAGSNTDSEMEKYAIYRSAEENYKALSILENALVTHPESMVILEELAEFHMDNDNRPLAKSVYERILLLDEDHSEAERFMLGMGSSSESKDIDWYENPAVDINTKIGSLLPDLRNAQNPENIMEKNLLSKAESTLKAHPMSAKASALVADIAFLLSDFEKASKQYLRAIELEPNLFTIRKQGLEALNYSGNDVRLLELSEDCLLYFPDKVESYWYNALALKRQGKWEEALTLAEEINTMIPSGSIEKDKFTVLIFELKTMKSDKLNEDQWTSLSAQVSNLPALQTQMLNLAYQFDFKQGITQNDIKSPLAQAITAYHENDIEGLKGFEKEVNPDELNDYYRMLRKSLVKSSRSTEAIVYEKKLTERGAFFQ